MARKDPNRTAKAAQAPKRCEGCLLCAGVGAWRAGENRKIANARGQTSYGAGARWRRASTGTW